MGLSQMIRFPPRCLAVWILQLQVSRKVQEADLQAIQRLLQRSHSQLTSADVAQVYKRLYELQTQQEAVALVPDLLQQLTPLWLSKLPEAQPHEIAAALVTCQHYGYDNENLWHNSLTAITKESCLLHARVQDIINVTCAAAACAEGSWSIPGMATETAASIFKVLAAQLPAPEQSKASMQILIRLLDKYRRWGGSLHELLRDINHAQDMRRGRMGEVRHGSSACCMAYIRWPTHLDNSVGLSVLINLCSFALMTAFFFCQQICLTLAFKLIYGLIIWADREHVMPPFGVRTEDRDVVYVVTHCLLVANCV